MRPTPVAMARPANPPTARVVAQVLTGVPASEGEVDAAAERDGVIDDDDLLMVDRSGRVGPVDFEMHSARGDSVEQADRGDTEPESVEGGQQPHARGSGQAGRLTPRLPMPRISTSIDAWAIVID